jgi:hypothetical protein
MEVRQRGHVPAPGWCGSHVIVVLDDWQTAGSRYRLVIPPNHDPAAFDFSGIAGLAVMLIHDSRRTKPSRRDTAIRALLKYLPEQLTAFDVARPHAPLIVKSKAVGIELAKFL